MIMALIVASLSTVPEGEMIPAFFTGNRLFELCAEPADGTCAMYVVGVLDGVFHSQSNQSDPSICGGHELNSRQAAYIVVQFLRENPDIRDKAAAVTVDLALRPRLTCTDERSDAS